MGEPTRAGIADRSFVPEILIMYCQRCVAPSTGVRGGVHLAGGVRIKLVALPCTSKVEVPDLLRVLEAGVEAVQVVGCPDRRCRLLTGSRTASLRVQRTRRLLEAVDVGAERAGMVTGADLDLDDLLSLGRDRARAAAALGPNPMKGAQRG
jgi:coenzyme F420-reducing hydrogenase delta subunit